MEHQELHPEQLEYGRFSTELPIGDALKDRDASKRLLAPELLADGTLLEQIETRRQQADSIESCLDQLPRQTTLLDAVEYGIISEQVAHDAYIGLTQLLQDPDSHRIL